MKIEMGQIAQYQNEINVKRSPIALQEINTSNYYSMHVKIKLQVNRN